MLNKNAPAISRGYTRVIAAEAGFYDLRLAIRPETDTDGEFRAWCLFEHEWLTVNGFACQVADVSADEAAELLNA
jgi:hypothetical protein